MDLFYGLAFTGGIEEGWPRCGVYFGEEGLKGLGRTWTGVEACSGCNGAVPFGDSWRVSQLCEEGLGIFSNHVRCRLGC
jgi:hypothetical protein